ncbi:MAG: hypothetical protein COA86_13005 [Kangiella sp.]|nr:MAG: hypothetical protein COA86_13005 [Kangiella sp.]
MQVISAINETVFPSIVSSWYWTSSPASINSGRVWGIDFSDGKDGSGNESVSLYIRLVRGGQ